MWGLPLLLMACGSVASRTASPEATLATLVGRYAVDTTGGYAAMWVEIQPDGRYRYYEAGCLYEIDYGGSVEPGDRGCLVLRHHYALPDCSKMANQDDLCCLDPDSCSSPPTMSVCYTDDGPELKSQPYSWALHRISLLWPNTR
jgi:hypothetical protein